tara:strand:- start:3832 stop:7287 length:3456 start_codon:yes stop_codon:yes gene_type:complete
MAGEQEILKNIHYNNYIYLFNNPYDIIISKMGTAFLQGVFVGITHPNQGTPELNLIAGRNFYNNGDLDIADGFLKSILTTTVNSTTNLSPAAIEADSNPIIFSDRGKLGDFPSLTGADTTGFFARGDNRPSILDESAANIAGDNDTQIYKFTNDFGLNPGKRHEFEISTQNGYSVSYNFENLKAKNFTELTNSSYRLITQGLGEKGADLRAKELNQAKKDNQIIVGIGATTYPVGPLIYNLLDVEDAFLLQILHYLGLEGIPESSALDFQPSFVKNGSTGFNYSQKFYFGAFIHNNVATDTAATLLDIYFSLISIPLNSPAPSAQASIQDRYEVPYNDIRKKVFNCATKIGVPYDHKTLLTDNVDLKSYGVKDTAPTYQVEYNYYDPQYEPRAISLINEGVLNENALPSIYDLIYLPLQYELMKATFGIPDSYFSSQDLNFSNLNSYFDNLSLLYTNYVQGAAANNGDVDEFGSVNVGSAAPMEYLTLSDLGDQLKGGDVAELEPDNIFRTSKSLFLNDFELYGADGVNFSPNYTKELYIPKWLEEIKAGIYFSEKTMPYFNQATDSKNRFPFATTINIPQEQRGPIAKLFSKNNLLDAINTHAASLVVPNAELDRIQGAFADEDAEEGILRTYANFYGGMTNGYSYGKFNMYNEVKLKTFKMHFVNKSTTVLAAGTGEDFAAADLFLDNFESIGIETPKNVLIYSEDKTVSTSGLLALLGKIKSEILLSDLESFLTNGGLRSPRDIQQGKFAHQETLMYEIAKYEVIGATEQYLQSIFLPIVNQDTLNYVDTQIIPYKNYYYKIFAHKVIVGTKYRAKEMQTVEQNGLFTMTSPKRINPPSIQSTVSEPVPEGHLFFEHEYEVEPYLQFVRVPYYNAPMVNVQTDAVNLTRVEDFPPMPPQVQVVPYRGNKNKILFLLNNSVGNKKETVVPIADSDLSLFDDCAISQGVNLPSEDFLSEISFKNDDIPKSYTIFRTEIKPHFYMEFSDQENAISFDTYLGQTSFIDNIIPNKDYFYTFRTTDVHGKISNPTVVYQIRIVSEKNVAPYLLVSTFDPRQEQGKILNEKLSPTKTFQKYLLLGLNRSQNNVAYPNLEFNSDDQAVGDYLEQPVAMNSVVFGKKYKLRITSKQTGKKIDINIDFKNPKNIINDV